MGIIDRAIREGVELGIYQSAAAKIEEMGDCYDDPEDRCVMRPQDGCACIHTRWERLPWYRRLFTAEPKKPSAESALSAAFKLVLDEIASKEASE